MRRESPSKDGSLKSIIVKASLIAGALCLVVGGFLFFNPVGSSTASQNAEAVSPATIPVATPDPTSERSVEVPLPKETFKPTDKDTYTPPKEPVSVSPAPMSLSIPSVGINTTIVSGGEKNGSMVLPESSKVAVYTAAAPLKAEKGSTVIAGHVNFADGSDGALGPLRKVTKGAPVYATDADGTIRKYKVVAMDVLSKQALPTEIFRTAGNRQLVLVTCGGDIEKVNGVYVYTHNLVVTAEPV